ncbi:MAG: hypothetical protein ACE5IL_02475 [Myxococcota bacterium]
MQFWSRGLGRRSMGIDCGTEKVAVEGNRIVLRGTVRPPLSWPYTITMDADDWVAFFELTVHPTIVRYLLHPRRWRVALRALGHLLAFLAAYLADCGRARLSRPTASQKVRSAATDSSRDSPPGPRPLP